MRLRALFALLLAAAVLSACNQSGRPRGDSAESATPPGFGQIKDGRTYVVAPGDTVAVVAKRTNTPIRTLIDMNHLVPPYRLVSGQRLAIEPRGEYVVQPGDTVSAIAARQGISPSSLIQLNGLQSPYVVQTGQRLTLPTQSDAPQTAATGAQPFEPVELAPANPPPSSSNVSSSNGSISTGNLPPLAGTNTAAPQDSQVASTQPLPQPQAKPFEPQVLTPPDTPAETEAPTDPQELKPLPQAAIEQPAAVPAEPKPEATQPSETPVPKGAPLPLASAESGFIWPVEGKIVSRFGTTAEGLRNDGVNIAAPVGAPVKAAADGVVAYAGNELRGFGNMVPIKHADGWVTAYAHNSSLLVQKGDTVGRGDTIARVGSTGNVASPQLHFELRKGTSAVDPVKQLGG